MLNEKISMGDRFQQILNRMEEEEKNRKDIILPLSQVRMSEEGRLFGGKLDEVAIGGEALGQLCRAFGFSKQHIDLLLDEGRIDLVADQLNHFLAKEDRNEIRQFRIVDGRVKGIVSDRYKSFDDYHLFNLLNEVRDNFPEVEVENFFRDDRRTHARFTFPELFKDIGIAEENGKGDIVKIGFDVTNSEIGYSTMKIVPVTYRLVCTNGLITWVADKENSFKTRHIGFEAKSLEKQIREGIAVAIEEGQNTIELMKKSRNEKIDDVYEEIEKIGKNEGLGKKQIEAVKDLFKNEPQDNLFGVVNAFTRYGRDLEKKAKNNELRVKVEEIAGKILHRVA